MTVRVQVILRTRLEQEQAVIEQQVVLRFQQAVQSQSQLAAVVVLAQTQQAQQAVQVEVQYSHQLRQQAVVARQQVAILVAGEHPLRVVQVRALVQVRVLVRQVGRLRPLVKATRVVIVRVQAQRLAAAALVRLVLTQQQA
jgi:hypothetical protein